METKETLTAALEEFRDTVALHMDHLDEMHPDMQAALFEADQETLSEIIRRFDDFTTPKLIK